MRLLLALVFLSLIAGCSSPAQIRNYGEQYRHVSTLPPREAAQCLGRAAEKHRGDWHAEWREGGTTGGYEVIVGSGDRIIIADVTPQGSGSSVTLYAQKHVDRFVRDRGVAAMFKGC